MLHLNLLAPICQKALLINSLLFGEAYAINQGIPLIEQELAYTVISEGEIITIDFEKCEIICKDDLLKFKVIPEVVVKILASGGLIPLTKKSLGK